MSTKVGGVVKWFSNQKGFGFILYDNQDWFIHHKNINGEGYKNLFPDQKVMFEPAKTPKGNRAINLDVV